MSELEILAAKIRALPPPDALRLAADLLDHRRPELAYQIIERVKVELGASLALAAIPKPNASSV